MRLQTVSRASQEDKMFQVYVFTAAQRVEQGTNTGRFESQYC